MPRATPLVACLLLLALPFVGAADSGTGSASDWETVLEITSDDAGAEKMFEAFDTASLSLYDFDGDDQLEIVSVNDNNRLYVIDSRSGRVLAELQTYHYNNSRWPTRELNPVAIGDLYGDGVPCMVVPNSASYLTAFCFDAAASTPLEFAFEKKWEVHVDAQEYEEDFEETHPYLFYENGTAKHTPGMDGHAYLANVDGKPGLEVFVETDSWPGQFAFSHEGEYLWSKSFADGNAGATVRDIDDDGQKEAVFFSDGGLVTAYTARTGGVEWVFDTRKHGATPGATPVPGLVADLDGDDKFETVFGARNVTQTNDPNWINESHARYYALDSKGKILWNVSYDWMNPLTYTHPAAADVNGDGTLDIITIDWNTVGHKPGNWNTTNRPANLFALDGRNGQPLWHRGVTIYWSNKDLNIFDVDGDGRSEVVAPQAKSGCEGLGVFDLRTGEPEGFYCAGGGWGMSRGPVAGDLYGDGHVYLVVPYNQRAEGTPYRSIDVGYREGKLVVIRTDAMAKSIRFSGNFQLNDEIDTGAKGAASTPIPSPTPPTPTPATPTPSPSPSPSPVTPEIPTYEPDPDDDPVQPTVTPTPIEATPTPTDATPTPDESTTPDEDEESDVPAAPVAIVVALVAALALVAGGRRRP